MGFDLKDYELVQDRIPKFLEAYKDGNPQIITTLMSDVNKLEYVVFKAELISNDVVLATGWAYERDGSGYVNKTSHLENCETSAIGRALANIAIHGSKRPSREEMEKVRRMETEQSGPIVETPKESLKKQMKTYGVKKEELAVHLKKNHNKELKEMTDELALQYILLIKDGNFDLPFDDGAK